MSKKDIRISLLKQLKDKGADVDHFVSLVDDYLWYWEQERKMKADIKERGMSYPAVSASGKDYEKDNPSVKNAVMYNKQKLSILRELGLSTEKVLPPEDEEDNAGM